MIRIQLEPFDAAVELAALTERSPTAGAVAAFVGLVRPYVGDAPVERLELQRYGRFTRMTVETIAEDASQRFDLIGLPVIHRCGTLVPGEAIVFVAAAAEHRRAAFDAVDYLMDRLKTEAAFWKREHGPAGSRWIEPHPADHVDRKRWDEGNPPAKG